MEASVWVALAFAHLAAVEAQGHRMHPPPHVAWEIWGERSQPSVDALPPFPPSLLRVHPVGAASKLRSSGCAQHPSVARDSPGWTPLVLGGFGEAKAAAPWAAPRGMLGGGCGVCGGELPGRSAPRRAVRLVPSLHCV